MYKLIPIVILLTILSCKKNGEQAEPTTAVTVKEFGSSTPIANAAVAFSKYSLVNGTTSTIFTGYTSDDGICQVPTKYYNEPGALMVVSATKYLSEYFLNVTDNVALRPQGWIKVLGIKTPSQVHPDALFILLYQDGGGFSSDNLYPMDTDSIVLGAVGGQATSIVWRVINSSSDTLNSGLESDIMVPKFDTITIEHLSGY